MPTAIAIIPARYASNRFPGKALVAATGRPLIQHVYERAQGAARLERIIVAADDERIITAVRSFGGEAVPTRADHPNGTSRIAEVVETLRNAGELEDSQLIANVQGDEPEIDPGVIDLAIDTLGQREDCSVSTVASPFAADENPADPNIVKVVLDAVGRALYFSRSAIPFDRDGSRIAAPLKHVGLYVYRPAFLLEYAAMRPTPLEQTEQLEQLRILEHGRRIAVAIARTEHHGIDTPAQYADFVERWRSTHSG